MKLIDARKDYYRKLAKNEGFRSRSAYKLLQLNKSYHFLKKGSRVLDIGSYPGGWLQVARSEVGNSGLVIGTDIKQIENLKDVLFLNYSVEDPALQEYLITHIRHIDVVLSDLSPNISGIWEIDHIKQINLSRIAFHVAGRVLQNGGTGIFKLFDGEMLKDFINELSNQFQRIKLSKPVASRQSSSEMYIVCSGYQERNWHSKEINLPANGKLISSN